MAKRKTPKGWYSSDVCWRFKKLKKPIAYSTVCGSSLIALTGADNMDKTFSELRDMFIVDSEEYRVLDQYAKRLDCAIGDFWEITEMEIFEKEESSRKEKKKKSLGNASMNRW